METPLELGQEAPPPDEAAFTEKLRALHLKVHQAQPGPDHRGEHPKQHAGLWAQFEVESDIPPELRIGLFAEPRSYTALVRYSNGRSFDDTKPDVRGMAVKVLVPRGDAPPLQQDFMTANHPIFFARNVQHIFEFLVASVNQTPREQMVITHPKLVGFAKPADASLLATTYWSQTPYRLGAGAVKYLWTPTGEAAGMAFPIGGSPDFLREALIEQLTFQKKSARFNLWVNPQTDVIAEPIEDPTVEWVTTPIRLATLTIYPQRFDSPAQMSYFENLSWSPWNSLPEHAPLGGINRARRLVYQDSSELRHRTTGLAVVAPTGREIF